MNKHTGIPTPKESAQSDNQILRCQHWGGEKREERDSARKKVKKMTKKKKVSQRQVKQSKTKLLWNIETNNKYNKLCQMRAQEIVLDVRATGYSVGHPQKVRSREMKAFTHFKIKKMYLLALRYQRDE